MEEECLPDKIRKTYIPSFDEIREAIFKIYKERVTLPKRVKKRTIKYLIKADKINDFVSSKLSSRFKAIREGEINGFYSEVIKLAGLGELTSYIKELNDGIWLTRILWRKYRSKIKNSLSDRDARILLREYVGRVLSVFRRRKSRLDALREAMQILSRTPCIKDDVYTVVIAGMPQAGKSTFVNRISTAKSKVSPFPFTTKDIVLGHAEVNGIRMQVIDTPGILDRPFDELNPIERKAYMAIKYLAHHVLFLIDPSENSYYSIESQLRLLSNIVSSFNEEDITIIINKVDAVSNERLKAVKELISKAHSKIPVYEVSALYGIGIDKVLMYLASKFEQGFKPYHY